MPNVVGERFQITIDKKVRDELRINPGDIAVERAEAGRLVVTFMPRPHNRSMLGALRGYIKGPIEPITDWQAMKDRAWAMRTAEIMESLQDAPGDDGTGR
jgi:bifunctional DNA-binding transcriptional regulator/antitoxin component of YhaV-PrlF toxin-antitoxin module